MKLILHIFNEYPKSSAFVSGFLLSLAFAPIFFIPALIVFGVIAFLIRKAEGIKEAFLLSYLFGFGFFLSGLYWISIGVSVYYEQFWWAIPIALFFFPAFLAIYTGIFGACAFLASKKNFYILSFSAFWIALEILRGYLFTGFPWNSIGYSLAFSDVLIQSTSFFGIYGLGFFVVFTSGLLCYLFESSYKKLLVYIGILSFPWAMMFKYGYTNLENNPTTLTPLKLRLVQPSIRQTDKWSSEMFWDNLNAHKDLSMQNIAAFDPDIIIWPESAVIVQPTFVEVFNLLKTLANTANSFLITGGITDNLNNPNRSRDKLFASLYAVSPKGEFVFDYHKSHLVPFGEYVPLSNLLPVNKLTPGSTPYTPGMPGFIVTLDYFNLKIRPLLCYEVIFPGEVLMSNEKADVLLNLTNDAYYGVSSGPYQHLYMARVRAVENGMPLVRVANNGISAVIDPVGRILSYTRLNQVATLDSYLPLKLDDPTSYSKHGDKYVYMLILVSLFLTFVLPKNEKLD